MGEQSGRVAVVFGGASGIGAAIADQFTAEGWTVEVADLPDTDVTDEASVAAFLDRVVESQGRLDLVVNSAGVSTLGNVVDLDVAEWRRVVDVCLTGAFIVMKHAGQRLTAGGSIISLSSLNARQPGAGLAPYCASKAGLSMLTQAAMDIPGIEDDYLANTPLRRAGTPEEIAGAAVYLADAAWVTGEVLDINGGAHLLRYPDLNKHVLAAFG